MEVKTSTIELAPGITGEFFGQTPVQGEGQVDGHAWYFRARWNRWAVYISPTANEVDFFNAETWIASEFYDNAGYMPVDEAKICLLLAIEQWRAERKSR